MSYNVIVLLVGWLIVIAIFLGFIVLLRYLHHRERMALITHGIHPNTHYKQPRSRGILRAGLITMMVGISLTVGLYPIGFFLPGSIPSAPFHLGPWMLPGLIPLGVGLALVVSYYLEQSSQAPLVAPPVDKEQEKDTPEKVISMEDHLEKERREQGETRGGKDEFYKL